MSRPSVLVVNVHKGASTFIADEFSERARKVVDELTVMRIGSEMVRGATYDDLPLPAENGLIVRVYPPDVRRLVEPERSGRPFADKRLVFVYRDPRDVAVSWYYSTAYSHSLDVRNPERFLAQREELRSVDISEGIRRVSLHAIREFKIIRRLVTRQPGCLVTTYEELVGDYPEWLGRFCAHAGWSDDEQQRILAATRSSLEPPSSVDPGKHIRRVTPGNWQEVFDDRLIELFKRTLGDDLAAAGYHW